MKNILIAGGAGCVGHYLYDILSKNPEYELFLFVRDPKKIMFEYKTRKNVHVIEDDIKNASKYRETTSKTDYLINLTADWGLVTGNLNYNIELLNSLNPDRVQKVIYFSTASILSSDGKVNKETLDYGTPYIKGKYLMHQKLQGMPLYDKTITVFPTWVLGGDSKHPYSHASTAIKDSTKWLWLLRFFGVDIKFHFIHAKDIAAIVDHLLKSPVKNGEYILGNTAISADEIIDKACEYFKIKRYFKVPVTENFIRKSAKLLRKELTPWDDYCLKNREQVYSCVNTGTFGIRSDLDTTEKIFTELFGRK